MAPEFVISLPVPVNIPPRPEELKASDIDFFFTSKALEAAVSRRIPNAFKNGVLDPDTLRFFSDDIADALDIFANQNFQQLGREGTVRLLTTQKLVNSPVNSILTLP